MDDFSRKLPLYLLLDASASMSRSMDALRQGVDLLLDDLRADPLLCDAVRISVIALGRQARRLTAPTSVERFALPPLTPSGTASLSAGLLTLADCAVRDAYRPAACERGDWRPVAALFTDGGVTDLDALPDLRQRATLILCPTAPVADALHDVADRTLPPVPWTPGAFTGVLPLLDGPSVKAVAI